MRTPLQRIRLGAVYLGVVIAIAIGAYCWLGYNLLDSIWIVVVTLSSVGYGEVSGQSVGIRIVTILFILFGFTAAVYTVGGFIQMVTEGEVENVLGRRRTAREIGRLSDHVIVCGFGRVGLLLANALAEHRKKLIVIEQDAERVEQAQELGHLVLNGDATEELTLIAAGVERARTLVTSLPSDAANVFITLTSRNLAPKLHIISRAEHPTTEQKLRQAGANRVVSPAIIGAKRMERMITRPSTAELMEVVIEGANLEAELDEIVVPNEGRLAGATVKETEAHRRHRLLVVAVKHPGGQMTFNPDADYVFQPNDVVILMGRFEDIGEFRKKYDL